jgi:Secretion system C-terminal sorting domain
MKRSLLFFALISTLISFTPKTSSAQFALGDIAFTGYNSEGTEDAFSFVLLRNVTAGEQISFTENGWLAIGGFRTGENTVTLQFSGNYNCGSQIYISAVPFGARDETGASAGVLTGTGLALTVSGDQILAYDPANMPSPGDESGFVAGIHMNGAWDADATSTNTSAKPTVFTDGVNSISISPEVDNAQYNCTITTGDPTTVLAPAIWNNTNWNTDDATAYTAPAPCSLSCGPPPPCNDPTVPAATIINPTVCIGDSVMITISGTLNDATMWVVYTDSCGGTQIGSTTGTTIMVEVTAGTTPYFIRGEGGCVTPGSCGQTMAFGIPLDDASFTYPFTTYCNTDGLQTPSTTLPGGTFSSAPAGLSLTPNLGLLDPSLSTPNTYTVYYTTNGTCPSTDSTTIIVTICTGLNPNNTQNELSIYPNPSKGSFMVNLKSFDENTTLNILDILGKEVISKTITSTSTLVNITNKKGVYFLKIQSKKGTTVKKIIID